MTRARLIPVGFTADAALASYPKAGRTWLRYIIGNYLNERFRLGLSIDLESIFRVMPNRDLDRRRGLPAARWLNDTPAPLIVVSHEPYSRLDFGRLPILFMIRDPRDLMVSSYFHNTRHKHRLSGDISAFCRHRTYGIDSLIRYLNRFALKLPRHRHLVLSYEELSDDTFATAARALEFLDVPVDAPMLTRAVAASSFKQMREAELKNGIPGHAYDQTDPDSLRIRRGRVGGFAEHLSHADLAWLAGRCAEGLNREARALLEQKGLSP